MGIEAAFDGEVRRHPGDAGWHFVTLPLALADEIRQRAQPVGFGSVRVGVRIGATSWRTSVFPDSASGSYVLPVKAAVRRAEHLDDGTTTRIELDVEV